MKALQACLGESAFHEKINAEPHAGIALILQALAFSAVIKDSK